MIKKGLLLDFLFGGLFYIVIVSMYINIFGALTVKAEELSDSIENGFVSLDEEIESDSSELLSDSIDYIQGVNDDMENESNFEEDYSDSTSDSSSEEDMTNDDKFHIMIIFCFGLCAGVIVGHFLTGFIK